MKPVMEITQNLFSETIKGLALRSDNRRESACVWAGLRNPERWSVHEVIYLDDFPQVQGFSRLHLTPREASSALFRLLREKGLEIIADVHTHPGGWVDLSPTDREHPLEFRIGLLAIVLPYYAKFLPNREQLGVHEFLGSGKWKMLSTAEIKERLRFKGV